MAVLQPIKDAWRKNADELFSLWNGSMPQFVLARRPRELDGIPVFHYHLVDADFLAADLEFLAANGYRVLRSAELLEHLSGAQAAPARSVLLTFDDGPRNFFDAAFPVLRRHGAHAVAFVAPGLHAEADAGGDDTDARPMTWQEVAEIHASGLVEFQSHTLESRFVPRWPAPAALSGCDPVIEAARRSTPLALREDLAASRRALEARLPGLKVDQLAFPMYEGTRAAVDTAHELGFTACYWGLIPGRALNRPGDSPLFMSRLSSEFLRRLPGQGRTTLRELGHERLRRIREARAWRQRFAAAHG